MKKLIYGAMVLALAGITLYGCKKSSTAELAPVNTKAGSSKNNARTGRYYSDGKMLIFSDRAAYDLVVTNPADGDKDAFINAVSQMPHTSYSKYLADNRKEDDQMDDYLAVILNQDLVVQIGSNLYRVNTRAKSVFVLPAAYIAEYKDLVTENLANTHIKVFSINDDVLDIMEDGAEPQKALFCNESGIGGKESISNQVSIGNTGFQFWCYNDFNKFGIYYSLAVWVRSSAPNGAYRFYIQVENLWYHVKCGNTVGPYSFPWYSESPATKRIHKYQSYSGSKNLNGVHVKSRGRCEIPNAPQGGNPYTTLFTDWNRIQQNNPYFP